MKQSRTTLHAWLAASLLALGASAVQAQPQIKPQYIDPSVLGPRPISPDVLKPQPFRGDLMVSNFFVSPDKCSCEDKFRAAKLDGIIVNGPVYVDVSLHSNDRNAHPVQVEVSLSYFDRYQNQRRTVKKRISIDPKRRSGYTSVRFNPPRVIGFRTGITASVRALDRTFTDTNPRNNTLKQTGRKYCKINLK